MYQFTTYKEFEKTIISLKPDIVKDDIDNRINDLYELIIESYNDEERYYHTIDHIEDCLKQFNEVEHLANNPNEIKIALWFHDVYYKTYDKLNEKISATLAKIVLHNFSIDKEITDRISDMILATQTHEAYDNDSEFMLDIDLSILGADENKFDEYEENIRKEYSWVPEEEYKNARINILQKFIDRDNIYHTDYFRNKLEKQARSNIEKSIEKLKV